MDAGFYKRGFEIGPLESDPFRPRGSGNVLKLRSSGHRVIMSNFQFRVFE